MNNKIKVMQAALEGKTIEFSKNHGNTWETCFNPAWNWVDYEYRVKPLQVKPYNLKEFLTAIKVHGLIFKKYDEDLYYTIANFDSEGMTFAECSEESNPMGSYYYQEFADNYVWADDESPMGIIESYL